MVWWVSSLRIRLLFGGVLGFGAMQWLFLDGVLGRWKMSKAVARWCVGRVLIDRGC